MVRFFYAADIADRTNTVGVSSLKQPKMRDSICGLRNLEHERYAASGRTARQIGERRVSAHLTKNKKPLRTRTGFFYAADIADRISSQCI